MAHESTEVEWFVLKGEERFGPFNYGELVRMLQEKVVFSFDFAWNERLSGWKRIADIVEFQEASIRALANDKKQKSVLVERRHARHEHTGRVIVHDQKSWWRATATQISSGGAAVTVENSMLVPGSQIVLHFKAHKNFPAFNATAEVVSKKYMENIKDTSAPVEYGVRFLSVSGTGKDELLELLKESA